MPENDKTKSQDSTDQPKAQPGLAQVQDTDQDTSGYVGVSPEFQNYASDVFKPIASQDKDTKKLVDEVKKNEEANASVHGAPTSQSSPDNLADGRRGGK